MHTITSCPLAYCDPAQCGWRAGDTSCEWTDQAITTAPDTGATDEDETS